VLINGVNLNIKLVGSGPPLLALHGFAGDMSTWAKFVPEAAKRYTVITIDLLGHGGSDAPSEPERYRIDHTVQDVPAAIRELGFSKTSLLGYSMGGRIALAAALLVPDLCDTLVLEGTSPGLTSPKARVRRQIRDEALAELIQRDGIEAFINHWEKQPLFRTQQSLPPEIRKQIRSLRLKSNPIGLVNSLRAAGLGVQPPFSDSLSTLKIPVLCVVGEYDRKFTVIARRMCSKLRNGRIAVIPGAGHATHLEKPQDFNKVVLEFLE